MRRAAAVIIGAGLLLAGTLHASCLGSGEGCYLASDTFIFRQPNADDQTPSSYDSYELGGSVAGGSVADLSENAGVAYRRVFNPVESTADIHIGLAGKGLPEGGTISLMCGDTDAVTMQVSGGVLVLDTPDGGRTLDAQDEFWGIKISVDIGAGTYTFMLNGKTLVRDVPFKNKVEYLDRFVAMTPDAQIGGFEFKHFYVYTGFIVNEWFFGSHKTVPDDWTVIGTGASVSSENISVSGDMYGLKLDDASYTSECGIAKDISYSGDALKTEYLFFSDAATKDFGASLSAGGAEIIRVCADGTAFGYRTDGGFVRLYTLKSGLWYDVMLVTEGSRAKIYLNKKLLAEGIEIGGRADNVKFSIGKAATGKGCVDEIKVCEIAPEPADYVPEPVIPEKNGDYILGMQSCSLWREGTQMGWDFVNGYKERTPLIGFYDEGSPEVADWEIKWLTEHGIDYQMFCWFRQGSVNMPVQRPVQSWALHDGFMESKYGDKLKFVLMWENNNATGVAGMEDWQKNLVPYWIEWYFKDPRYLVIDNKPVMAMYWLPKLVQNFGSLDAVREAMRYLDSACREEGFDGVYLLFQADTRSPELHKQYKYVGADAIFSYTAKSDTAVGQKAQFEAQSATGIIDVIASPGMGWDNSAWGINNRIGWNDKATQLEIMNWLHDEYMPRQKGFAQKMITIDNWNEFSEGHWYYPSGIAGFDYLDAVREVFTNSPGHEDALPSDAAKARFQHLYVQSRKIPKSSVSRMLDKEEERKANYQTFVTYDFADGEDMSKYNNGEMIDNFRIENGCLSGTATGIDPKFYINNADVDAGNIKEIRARAKSTLAAPSRFQIFYITDVDPNWDEKKSVHTTLDNSGEWVELVMSASGQAGMKGRITDFRVDPGELTGDFAVDKIELRGEADAHNALLVDGAAVGLWRGIVYNDGRMYAPAAEYASLLGLGCAVTLDGKYVDMVNDDTGLRLRFAVGSEALVIDGEPYFPVRRAAEAAGFRVEWDSEKSSANVITAENAAPDGEENPVGEWNFDIAGNFGTISQRSNISGESIKNGVYTFSATTSDPIFLCKTDIVAEEKPYCNIRVRNKSQGVYFQIFYQTADERTWSEDKSAKVRLSGGDKDFKNYTVDMSSSAKWHGRITDLRIDPIDSTGVMVIDYIRFAGKPASGETVAASGGTNLIPEGMLTDKKLAYRAENLRAAYSEKERYMGRYSLEIMPEKPGGALYIPCEPTAGTRYTLTLWAKGTGGIAAGFYGGADKGAASETELAGDKWQRIEISFTAPEDGADGIYILPPAGGAYIDNIRLCG